MDESFARLALQWPDRRDPGVRARLLEHPALAAIVRHERLAGNGAATGEALLARILESVEGSRPGSGVLDAWADRRRDLSSFVRAAQVFLPAGTRFTGTAYLVVGYDIGVAAPPDIVLNVAHEHFLHSPPELGFYATHEAHHVGFLAHRPMPALEDLSDPEHLRAVIRTMTHLEGMGVHAAYPLRVERDALGGDPDYRVYTDEAWARRVAQRYGELMSGLSGTGTLADEDIGAVLNAMSSGERVWYQLGALACWTLERAQGREALVASITDAGAFDATVAELTVGSGAVPG